MSVHAAGQPSRLLARTKSVDETWALAASLAMLGAPGDLVLLSGDLGTGKTAFVQGFGRGLGVTEPITSPTFALAQRYDGELTLHHLDAYRLSNLHEVLELGLSELLDDRAVVLVEWGEAVMPVVPNEYLEVQLSFGEDTDERVVVLRPVGPRWLARREALEAAIVPWAKDQQ